MTDFDGITNVQQFIEQAADKIEYQYERLVASLNGQLKAMNETIQTLKDASYQLALEIDALKAGIPDAGNEHVPLPVVKGVVQERDSFTLYDIDTWISLDGIKHTRLFSSPFYVNRYACNTMGVLASVLKNAGAKRVAGDYGFESYVIASIVKVDDIWHVESFYVAPENGLKPDETPDMYTYPVIKIEESESELPFDDMADDDSIAQTDFFDTWYKSDSGKTLFVTTPGINTVKVKVPRYLWQWLPDTTGDSGHFKQVVKVDYVYDLVSKYYVAIKVYESVEE